MSLISVISNHHKNNQLWEIWQADTMNDELASYTPQPWFIQ